MGSIPITRLCDSGVVGNARDVYKRQVQTWTGCVIAASVIAFPLMYRNARAAFEQVDMNLIYAGRTLGMSESRIFWKVIMPAAGPGIASGTVLAFARAIGEYGATSMLAGNILGKTRTVSVAIASETAAGNYDMAGFWVIVIILILFLVVAAINIGRNSCRGCAATANIICPLPASC